MSWPSRASCMRIPRTPRASSFSTGVFPAPAGAAGVLSSRDLALRRSCCSGSQSSKVATIGPWSLKAYHAVGLNATHCRSLCARARDEHVVILAGDARVARIDLRPGVRAVLPERLELGPDPQAPEFSRGRPVDGQAFGGDDRWQTRPHPIEGRRHGRAVFGSAIALVSGAAPRLGALRRRFASPGERALRGKLESALALLTADC